MTTVETRDHAHERRRRPDFVWSELLPKSPKAEGCALPGALPDTTASEFILQLAETLHIDITSMWAWVPELGRHQASQTPGPAPFRVPAVNDDLLPRRVPMPAPEFIDLTGELVLEGEALVQYVPAPTAVAWDTSATSRAFKHYASAQFVDTVIAHVLERNGTPLTAYQLAREVLKRMPNLRARSTLERRCSKLAAKGVLRQRDQLGVSPDGAPCWRYEVAA